MKKQSFTFNLCATSAIVLATSSGHAAAQTPRANGETLGIQN
jgi:NitT/TauT family transport system substrate-binding protein